MLLEIIYNTLKSICILRIDNDLIKVSEDASSAEDVFQSCPHPFEEIVISIKMHTHIDTVKVG